MERLPPHLDPSQFASLKELYAHITRERGSLGAYSCLGKTLSYQEWDQLSDQFAAYLHHETALVPGDRIAIQLPNLLHFPVALLRCRQSRIGGSQHKPPLHCQGNGPPV